MNIDVLTLFPNMFESPFSESMIRRAMDKGLLKITIHNLRKFTHNKHHAVDDSPYGGGPGMVIAPEPIYEAVKNIVKNKKIKKVETKVVLTSPQGIIFDQKIAKKLSKYKHLIFICGHYEGVDERVMKLVDYELSIGNYVLTGGELPAMVAIDAVARLIPGVVKEKKSIRNDSFFNGLLDHPNYTRPRIYHAMKVPEILFSGNHNEIRLWRLKESLRNTYLKRPDLLEKIKLNYEQKRLLDEVEKEEANE